MTFIHLHTVVRKLHGRNNGQPQSVSPACIQVHRVGRTMEAGGTRQDMPVYLSYVFTFYQTSIFKINLRQNKPFITHYHGRLSEKMMED